MTNSTTSYASKAKKRIAPLTDFSYPDENQAIIFNHVENTKIMDYLKALLPLVKDPKTIIAASRISKNRVIVFLDSTDRVNSLLAKTNSFLLGENKVSFHRLRSPSSKLILSNVSPALPNHILEHYLTNILGAELVSPISILRVSPLDEQFGHVICMRRQVYIKPKSETNIPASFLLQFNNRSHRIFITHDEFTCFKCHQTGHKAEDCNTTVDLGNTSEWFEDSNENLLSAIEYPPLTQPTLTPVPVSTHQQLSSQASPEIHHKSSQNNFHADNNKIATTPVIPIPPHQPQPDINLSQLDTSKRRFSDTSSINSSYPYQQPDLKKPKEDTPSADQTVTTSAHNLPPGTPNDSDIEESVDPSSPPLSLIQTFESLEPHYSANQSRYPLTFQNFCIFADMCKGKQLISPVLQDFNLHDQIPVMLACVKECRSHVNNNAAKQRLTRLSKKLQQLLQTSN